MQRTDAPSSPEPELPLAGLRIAFTGRFASMTQRQAEVLSEQHGALATDAVSSRTDLLVVGEDGWPLMEGGQVTQSLQAAIDFKAQGKPIEILRETEWLARVGAVEGQGEVHRHYTPSMLARILGLSLQTVQAWIRRGLIRPVRHVYRLAYFDFQEAASAKRLSELIDSGVAPATVQRALATLERCLPGVERPLSQLGLLAEGNEILIRHGRHLVEPSGQRRFQFEPEPERDEAEPQPSEQSEIATAPRPTVAELCALAGELEDRENFAEALDVYHKALMLDGPNAEISFRLANLLYQFGQIEAARERFCVAVESDPDYVEAWSNLGCVLSELHQSDQAIEAFQCALAIHAPYADAHYHLADALEEQGRREEAAVHWRAYLEHDTRSTWADEARRRLAGAEGGVEG